MQKWKSFPKKGNETIVLQASRPDSIPVLLLPQIGLEQTDTIIACLQIGGEKVSREVIIPSMRHWTVYIYPHSHVDIGYTNTQENVEFIHKRNLDVAMDLAEKTADYPEDARFRWNPEVTWPIERYLNSESPEKKKKLIEAIKKVIYPSMPVMSVRIQVPAVMKNCCNYSLLVKRWKKRPEKR